MKIVKVVIVGAGAVCVSACSSAGFGTMTGSEHGIMEIRGDARGIEAYYQGLHGVVETAKQGDGSAPSTHEVYRIKEVERSRRHLESRSLFERVLLQLRERREMEQKLGDMKVAPKKVRMYEGS